MKDIDASSRLIIELVQLLVAQMQAMGKPWTQAFLRSQLVDGVQTHKASFVDGHSGAVLDPSAHKTMFARVLQLLPELREASKDGEQGFCVALLAVDPGFNYDLQFEFDDAGRWAISNAGDRNGFPAGYVAGASGP